MKDREELLEKELQYSADNTDSKTSMKSILEDNAEHTQSLEDLESNLNTFNQKVLKVNDGIRLHNNITEEIKGINNAISQTYQEFLDIQKVLDFKKEEFIKKEQELNSIQQDLNNQKLALDNKKKDLINQEKIRDNQLNSANTAMEEIKDEMQKIDQNIIDTKNELTTRTDIWQREERQIKNSKKKIIINKTKLEEALKFLAQEEAHCEQEQIKIKQLQEKLAKLEHTIDEKEKSLEDAEKNFDELNKDYTILEKEKKSANPSIENDKKTINQDNSDDSIIDHSKPNKPKNSSRTEVKTTHDNKHINEDDSDDLITDHLKPNKPENYSRIEEKRFEENKVHYLNDKESYDAFMQTSGNKFVMYDQKDCSICPFAKQKLIEFATKMEAENNPKKIKFAIVADKEELNVIYHPEWPKYGGWSTPLTFVMQDSSVKKKLYGMYTEELLQNVVDGFLTDTTNAIITENDWPHTYNGWKLSINPPQLEVDLNIKVDTSKIPPAEPVDISEFKTNIEDPLEFYKYWNSEETRTQISNWAYKNFGFKNFMEANDEQYLKFWQGLDYGNQSSPSKLLLWMQLADIKYVVLNTSHNNLRIQDKFQNTWKETTVGDTKLRYIEKDTDAFDINYDEIAGNIDIPMQEPISQLTSFAKYPLSLNEIQLLAHSVIVTSDISRGGYTEPSANFKGLPFGPFFILNKEDNLEDPVNLSHNYFRGNGYRYLYLPMEWNPLYTYAENKRLLLHEFAHTLKMLCYQKNEWLKSNNSLLHDQDLTINARYIPTNIIKYIDILKDVFWENPRSITGQPTRTFGNYENSEGNKNELYAEGFGEIIAYHITKFGAEKMQQYLAKGDDLLLRRYKVIKQIMNEDPGYMAVDDDPVAFLNRIRQAGHEREEVNRKYELDKQIITANKNKLSEPGVAERIYDEIMHNVYSIEEDNNLEDDVKLEPPTIKIRHNIKFSEDEVIYLNDKESYDAFMQTSGNKFVMYDKKDCSICPFAKQKLIEFATQIATENNPEEIKFAIVADKEELNAMSHPQWPTERGLNTPLTFIMKNARVIKKLYGMYSKDILQEAINEFSENNNDNLVNMDNLEITDAAYKIQNSQSIKDKDHLNDNNPPKPVKITDFKTEFDNPLEFYKYWNSEEIRVKISDWAQQNFGFRNFNEATEEQYQKFWETFDYGNTGSPSKLLLWMQLADIKYVSLSDKFNDDKENAEIDKAKFYNPQKYNNAYIEYKIGDKILKSVKKDFLEMDYDILAEYLEFPTMAKDLKLVAFVEDPLSLNEIKLLSHNTIIFKDIIDQNRAGQATINTYVPGFAHGPFIELDKEKFPKTINYNYFESSSEYMGSILKHGKRVLLHEFGHILDYMINDKFHQNWLSLSSWLDPLSSSRESLVKMDNINYVPTNFIKYIDVLRDAFWQNSKTFNNQPTARFYKYEANTAQEFAEGFARLYLNYNEEDIKEALQNGDDLLLRRYKVIKQIFSEDPGYMLPSENPEAFAEKLHIAYEERKIINAQYQKDKLYIKNNFDNLHNLNTANKLYDLVMNNAYNTADHHFSDNELNAIEYQITLHNAELQVTTLNNLIHKEQALLEQYRDKLFRIESNQVDQQTIEELIDELPNKIEVKKLILAEQIQNIEDYLGKQIEFKQGLLQYYTNQLPKLQQNIVNYNLRERLELIVNHLDETTGDQSIKQKGESLIEKFNNKQRIEEQYQQTKTISDKIEDEYLEKFYENDRLKPIEDFNSEDLNNMNEKILKLRNDEKLLEDELKQWSADNTRDILEFIDAYEIKLSDLGDIFYINNQEHTAATYHEEQKTMNSAYDSKNIEHNTLNNDHTQEKNTGKLLETPEITVTITDPSLAKKTNYSVTTKDTKDDNIEPENFNLNVEPVLPKTPTLNEELLNKEADNGQQPNKDETREIKAIEDSVLEKKLEKDIKLSEDKTDNISSHQIDFLTDNGDILSFYQHWNSQETKEKVAQWAEDNFGFRKFIDSTNEQYQNARQFLDKALMLHQDISDADHAMIMATLANIKFVNLEKFNFDNMMLDYYSSIPQDLCNIPIINQPQADKIYTTKFSNYHNNNDNNKMSITYPEDLKDQEIDYEYFKDFLKLPNRNHLYFSHHKDINQSLKDLQLAYDSVVIAHEAPGYEISGSVKSSGISPIIGLPRQPAIYLRTNTRGANKIKDALGEMLYEKVGLFVGTEDNARKVYVSDIDFNNANTELQVLYLNNLPMNLLKYQKIIDALIKNVETYYTNEFGVNGYSFFLEKEVNIENNLEDVKTEQEIALIHRVSRSEIERLKYESHKEFIATLDFDKKPIYSPYESQPYREKFFLGDYNLLKKIMLATQIKLEQPDPMNIAENPQAFIDRLQQEKIKAMELEKKYHVEYAERIQDFYNKTHLNIDNKKEGNYAYKNLFSTIMNALKMDEEEKYIEHYNSPYGEVNNNPEFAARNATFYYLIYMNVLMGCVSQDNSCNYYEGHFNGAFNLKQEIFKDNIYLKSVPRVYENFIDREGDNDLEILYGIRDKLSEALHEIYANTQDANLIKHFLNQTFKHLIASTDGYSIKEDTESETLMHYFKVHNNNYIDEQIQSYIKLATNIYEEIFKPIAEEMEEKYNIAIDRSRFDKVSALSEFMIEECEEFLTNNGAEGLLFDFALHMQNHSESIHGKDDMHGMLFQHYGSQPWTKTFFPKFMNLNSHIETQTSEEIQMQKLKLAQHLINAANKYAAKFENTLQVKEDIAKLEDIVTKFFAERNGILDESIDNNYLHNEFANILDNQYYFPEKTIEELKFEKYLELQECIHQVLQENAIEFNNYEYLGQFFIQSIPVWESIEKDLKLDANIDFYDYQLSQNWWDIYNDVSKNITDLLWNPADYQELYIELQHSVADAISSFLENNPNEQEIATDLIEKLDAVWNIADSSKEWHQFTAETFSFV